MACGKWPKAPVNLISMSETQTLNSPSVVYFGHLMLSLPFCGHLPRGRHCFPCAASVFKAPWTVRLMCWLWWVWRGYASERLWALPHADPLLSTHSFSPVLTPFRRRCGMRRRGGRRKRSGRRSARAHASPAHSRSCSVLGLGALQWG